MKLTRLELFRRMDTRPGEPVPDQIARSLDEGFGAALYDDEADAHLPFQQAEEEAGRTDFVAALQQHVEYLRTLKGEALMLYLAEAVNGAEDDPTLVPAWNRGAQLAPLLKILGVFHLTLPLAIPGEPDSLMPGLGGSVHLYLFPELEVMVAVLSTGVLDRSPVRLLDDELGAALCNVALHRAVDRGEPDPLARIRATMRSALDARD